MMGRKLNLSHLSEDECEAILQVIQRDFEIRQKEKHRLSKIEEEIRDEDTKSTILTKQKQFNDNCCMRCFSRFFFIFNQKLQCMHCKHFICKDCSKYNSTEKQYECDVCIKQRELSNQSCEWFYSNVKRKFKRFGSAKVVRSLYKRKTDSDSETENDSGYDPSLYSNSMPIGKRSRQSIEGFFASLSKDFQKELLSPPKKTNGAASDSEGSDVGEEPISKDRVDRLYQTPYTCTVGTGKETLDDVRQKEIKEFKHELNGIINDIHRTLDKQTPNGIPNGQTSEEYERLLDNHRLQLTASLANLTQSLYIAVDNQSASDPLTSPTTKHQYVRELVAKEVEQYLGKSVEINGDDTTSEYASEDGSTTNGELSSPRGQDEAMVEAIFKKILQDHHDLEEQRHLAEENDVREELTKLSNQCTVAQLNDMLSTTGSETDDLQSSAYIGDTDVESQLSDSSDAVGMAKDSDNDSVRSSHSNNRYRGKGLKEEDIIMSYRLRKSSQNNSTDTLIDENLDDLDNLVRLNEEAAGLSGRGHKRTKESDDVTVTVTSPDGMTSTPIMSRKSHDENSNDILDSEMSEIEYVGDDIDGEADELSALKNMTSSRPIPISREVVEENLATSPTDSEDTLDAEDLLDDGTPIQEEFIHKVNVTREFTMPDLGSDDDDSAFEFAQKHTIPLPSFDQNDTIEREEIDLDDISRHGDEEDDELLNETTLDSEIMFGSYWDANEPNVSFRERNKISAYDNLGEKKVGKDMDGPVYMFIPKMDDVQSPRVGGRDVDELSDLSENEDKSDVSEGNSDDEEDFVLRLPIELQIEAEIETIDSRDKKYEMFDTSVKTDLDPMTSGQASAGSNRTTENASMTSESKVAPPEEDIVVEVSQEQILKRAQAEFQKKMEKVGEEETSPDPEDMDPRFISKPKSQVVAEGEVARFTCQVSGTKPLDVFWYKDMAEIQQLDEDERCEISIKEEGKFILDVFNTVPSDAGQYLCIAISETGQTHKSMDLFIKDNPSEKVCPEFLKELQDVEVTEGKSARFRCKLRGYPPPRVLWYKDGKRIKNSQQYHIEKLGNRDYLLTLDKVTMEDDAEYTVVAKNIAGEAKSRAQLIVESTDTDVGHGSEMSDSFMEDSVSSSANVTQSDRVAYPDTSDLLKIAEQVHTARSNVTSTAENVLHSANQLSSMHNQLDEMDRKLYSLEGEVHDAISPQSDSVISEDDSINNNNNSYVSNSLRERILREHIEMKTAAQAVRKVTSTGLQALASAEKVLNTEQTINPDESSGTKRKAEEIVLTGLKSPMEENMEEEEVDLNLSFGECEVLYKLGKITREQIRKGQVPKKDWHKIQLALNSEEMKKQMEAEERSHDVTLGEDFPLTLDCGLKRVDSKRYKRDYVINRSPSVRRKKWEVQKPSPLAAEVVKATPAGERETVSLDDTEENIYMTASKVFILEDRIRQLESHVSEVNEGSSLQQLDDLEDEVARAVAQASQTEREVTQFEHQLESRSPVSAGSQSSFNQSMELPSFSAETNQVAQSPRVKMLRGQTSAEDIPESRTETDDDMQLPSVKNLRSKFNEDSSHLSPEGATVKRFEVYSLTARDLPRNMREKLKSQSSTGQTTTIVRVPEPSRFDTKRRPDIMHLFDDSDLQEVKDDEEEVKSKSQKLEIRKSAGPRSSTPLFPDCTTPARGQRSLQRSPNQSAISSSETGSHDLSVGSRSPDTSDMPRSPINPTSRSSSIESRSSEASSMSRSLDSSEMRIPGAQGDSMLTDKKGRSSAIMARAAFWDSKVQSEGSEDPNIPDMPQDSFKSPEEV